jgi:hypothetical protein
MKEIKVRVWDSYHKVMIYQTPCIGAQVLTSDLIALTESGYGNSNHERYIAMQFIGGKDKSGQEIYEGDILEHDSRRYRVYWCDVTLTWCAEGWGFLRSRVLLRVVGNIYENPTLELFGKA